MNLLGIGKKYLLLTGALLATMPVWAQKKIFIPEELRNNNFDCDTSQWSWKRSAQTPDLVFFWQKGFGDDWKNPPKLDGHDMHFNLLNLEKRVESFYHFFHDTLKFTKPGSKADRYKMMVMINYSLEGTAYGGTYDNFIGALWVAPNRIQDEKLNCLAHELGHCFQLQIPADSMGDAWGGSGFYEMTSQWMLWQVNPDWVHDEQYHYDAFKKLTHLAFLHVENIYHSPYVIEWWSELHGKPFIAELYREGKANEDPVVTYKRLSHLTQSQFCDEMALGYCHLLNFDFSHARKETRRYACTLNSTCVAANDGWLEPAASERPQQYGFNAFKLKLRPEAKSVKVSVKPDTAGTVRYAVVAIDAAGNSHYSAIKSEGNIKMKLPAHTSTCYLMVMGAPEQHLVNKAPSADDHMPVYGYKFKYK